MPASSAGRAARTRGESVRVGRDRGADHGRMIPTMSGLARPELLATTEWLAEQLGRPGRAHPRRPLATGRDRRRRPPRRATSPAPVHVDWRTDLVDTRSRTAMPSASAARTGSPRSPSEAGHRRRDDGRHLRRHAGAVRGARVVDVPGLRPGARPDPRRRVPGLGGGGPARSSAAAERRARGRR